MYRALLAASTAIFAVFGQPAAKAPAFEVATIKPNNSGNSGIGGPGICLSSGKISVTNMPLSLVIESAYGVKQFQLIGRPGWLGADRFDIEARAGSPVKFDQCKLMVQTLLAERFGLVVHRETRQLQIFRLLVEKGGPKLEKIDADAPTGVERFSTLQGELITRGTSMSKFAEMLAVMGEIEHQVVDATGLDGNYKFKLEWTPARIATEGTPGPSLSTALKQQLGLRLEAGKGPVEVLVIDRLSRVPTGN